MVDKVVTADDIVHLLDAQRPGEGLERGNGALIIVESEEPEFRKNGYNIIIH